MKHALTVAAYGLVVSGVAATSLASLPNFQPNRNGFNDRFVYAFWRFALPAVCFQELILWLVLGRVFP